MSSGAGTGIAAGTATITGTYNGHSASHATTVSATSGGGGGGGGVVLGDWQGVQYITDTSSGYLFAYQVFLPLNYVAGVPRPITVALNGLGDFGGTDGTAQIQTFDGPIKSLGAAFDAIVIAPEFNYTQGTYNAHNDAYRRIILQLITQVAQQYTGDLNRVTVTGYSFGAMVGWTLMHQNPTTFAGYSPLSGRLQPIYWGYAETDQASAIAAASVETALYQIPIWMYHGAQDGTVPVQYARDLYNGLSSNGDTNVHYTEDPNGAHVQSYWQGIYSTQSFWDWLLAQQRPTQLNTSNNPSDPATGAGIMHTDPAAPPIVYDWAQHYDGQGYGGDADQQWRKTRVYSGFTASNPSLSGGQSSNKWPAATFGDGFGQADLIRLVQHPDPAFGPVGWDEPAWEDTQYPNNDAGESNSGQHWCVAPSNSPQEAYSVLLMRRFADCSTPQYTMVGDATSVWGQIWNAIQQDNVFTLTAAVTPTWGNVTVHVTDTGQLNRLGSNGRVLISAGTANAEWVTPTNVTATSFDCTPSNSHASGDSCSVKNNSQAAAKKWGPYASYLGNGRAGVEASNGTNPPGNGFTHPSGNYFTTAGYNGNVAGGGITTGITPLDGSGNFMGAEISDGKLLTEAVYIEQWTDTNGVGWTALTLYWKHDGDANWTKVSRRMVGRLTNVKFFLYSFTGLNYNQSRSTPLKRWHTHWAVWDVDTYPDPAGFIGYYNSVMPTAPGAVVIQGTPTASAVSAKVTIGMNAGSLRAEIDGVMVNGQDYVLARSDGEENEFNGVKSGPAQVTMNLTGLALAAGAHTLKVYCISKDGSKRETTGASVGFTV